VQDLIGRTITILIITLFTIVARNCVIYWAGLAIELTVSSLLISFYCYEYKTAAASIDTATGLQIFESQWIYFLGFGFPFAVLQFLLKDIGQSIFFFFFPFLVLISMNEAGMGLALVTKGRLVEKDMVLPLFSTALRIKGMCFKRINQKIYKE
jgi:etoposide-induced 2.4 mRNA